MTKLLSRLNKSEILSLPGFSFYKDRNLPFLKELLKDAKQFLKIDFRGVSVQDYIDARKAYRKKMRSEKRKNKAFEQLMNIKIEFKDTKTAERRQYEENVHDKKKYQAEYKRMMIAAKNHESFEVNINDDSEVQYAFTQVLRYIRKHSSLEYKPIVYGYDMNDNCRMFNLSKEVNFEDLLKCILGEITIESYSSDSDPALIGFEYIPVRFEVKFIYMKKKEGKTDFLEKIDGEEVVIESIDVYRGAPEGAFFPYINLLDSLSLARYQIYDNINKQNYRDNCFVYACIQSGVFTDEEIYKLRTMMLTRSIPNKKITQIAEQMKCHFVVCTIDEKRESRHMKQLSIDTRKNNNVNADRLVQLLLYKEHYMIDMNETLPISKYYIEHKTEIDEQFSHKPVTKRQLIKNKKGETSTGTSLATVLTTMFKCGFFREINQCEQGILETCEYDNHLNDYINLDFDEELCCKEESTNLKKITEWSHIYYADYETDVTVSPHKPYLCCVCDDKNVTSFTGPDLTSRFLNSLQTNSLTYFHNLKYDACFFINEPGWETQITQRSGTLLQVIMDKKKTIIDKKTKKSKEIREKHLTFRNSYSIIPAPLRDFANMFKLTTHKEIISYKIYTEENIKRKMIPFSEFYDQYVAENKDKQTDEQLEENRKQLIKNAKFANAYNENNSPCIDSSSNMTMPCIDIIQYAKFYCIKDCLTLMKGMNKFNDDLAEVFKETSKTWVGIHQFISISAVIYDFARIYGCFIGCHQLSGKPQNFIQRCVSGGRTMTADNQKQYIEGRIQDFDAVSLYPSAMSIMDGIPQGTPQIIPDNCTHQQLMSYDAFFAEVNITKLLPKSEKPYRFGHIYKRNE
ncbi:hypothetical protein M9Y10_013809 [Tritrichomonas musculus]|uniref:DNA-directed DNA polymerase n=1 Tax=Tritrichomonas musculus TaxID=1915356 RepID=A0ABR2KYN0_9EUKA